MPFNNQTIIDTGSGLLNEILCILAAQGAEKPQEFKVEGLKLLFYHFSYVISG